MAATPGASPAKTKSAPAHVEGTIPITGKWVLRAVPILNITPDAPELAKLSSLETPFPIKGKCSNVLDGTKGVLTWTVITETEKTKSEKVKKTSYINETIIIHVKGSSDQQSFEIKIEENGNPRHGKDPAIHAIAFGLFGKGTVGYSFTLDFPHAPTAQLPAKPIPFDFACTSIVTTPASLKMGSRIEVRPQGDPIFNSCPMEMRFVENDSAKGESKNDEDGVGIIQWPPKDREPRSWFMGYQGSGRDGCLIYPEPKEEGAFEYDSELWLQDLRTDKWHRAELKSLLLKVEKPKLTQYGLTFMPGLFLSHFQVSGLIEGFDPKSSLHLQARLYQQNENGEGFMEEGTAECSLNPDGSFQMNIGHIHIMELDNLKKKKTGFFAALRISKYQTLKALPISQVVDYEKAKHPGLDAYLPDKQGQEYSAFIISECKDLNGGAVKIKPIMVTAAQLKLIMPNAQDKLIEDMIPAINQILPLYEISTPLCRAHFFAQCAHETDELRGLVEYASGSNYEGRTDLGNTQTGDGPRFKGRGLIHVTGRSNYQRFQDHLRLKSEFKEVNLMSGTNAEQLAQPIYACASGAWFWRNGNGDINPLAEADQFLEVTRKINPPAKGIDKRFEYLKRAYAAFDIADAQSRIANQRTILTKAGLITA